MTDSQLPKTYISPSYTAEKLNDPAFDDILDVFKDRMIHWVLEPVRKVLENTNGLFAALTLLMPYYETIWSYKSGESSDKKSKEFFSKGFIDVHQGGSLDQENLKKIAECLYAELRCGLVHESFARGRIYVGDLTHDMLVTFPKNQDGSLNLDEEIQSILIDPKKILACIERHFFSYLLLIMKEKNTIDRDCFFNTAKRQWDWESSPTIIGL